MVKKSELAKAKRIRNYINRIAGQNKKEISKVFLKLVDEINKNNSTNFAEKKEIKVLLSNFKRNMNFALSKIFRRSTGLGVDFVNTLFGYKLQSDLIQNIKNVVVENYIKNEVGKMVTNITKSTKNIINNVIYLGQKKGLNQRDIIKEIVSNVKGMSEGRARTIARTETSNAINTSSQETAKEAGIKYKKWIYTHISKVPRKAHTLLDGVVKKIDEYFDVNGHLGLYPHHKALPASEIINCECIVIYF